MHSMGSIECQLDVCRSAFSNTSDHGAIRGVFDLSNASALTNINMQPTSNTMWQKLPAKKPQISYLKIGSGNCWHFASVNKQIVAAAKGRE
jgi:hypothetical protein